MMAYQNSMKKCKNLGLPSSWRRMFRRTGILRHKSYGAFYNSDLEKLNDLTLHSVYLTHWCPPPGIPLSAIRMRVSQGPPIEIKKLAPSLVPYLKATSAANGFQDSEPKHKAFEVLEKALLTLTNPDNSFGLSWEILGLLEELLLKKSKVSKEKKTITEKVANVAIVNHILQHLTSGCFILNRGHSKVQKHPKRTYLPETFRLGGLTLGHIDAWYGELDMLVCHLNTGHLQPTVAVLFEKSDLDNRDNEYEEEDDFEEGFSELVIPEASIADEGKKYLPESWSLFGSRFSQGFATAVTFSYVYHYTVSATQSARSSLLPTIQISPKGYQIYFYDCVRDVMLANNFYWSRESMIYLWAFLHHHLFFPPSVDLKLTNCLRKFGYNNNDKSSGFYANRSNLLFGLSLNSRHWKDVDPDEGRML